MAMQTIPQSAGSTTHILYEAKIASNDLHQIFCVAINKRLVLVDWIMMDNHLLHLLHTEKCL